MNSSQKYKIAILILSLLVIFQWLFIFLISRPKKIAEAPPPPAIKGKIAVVIDDWGYNLHNLALIGKIKYPLTISVLPGLAYSRGVAEELHKRGFEIILHLPLQPKEKLRLEKNTIITSMDETAIKNILKQDLTHIKYASGVSNHMGSMVTEDSRTMEIILKELKKRNLYFLDSLVSSDSVCFDLAKDLRLGFAKRDVFLDNTEDPEYIRGQIHKLKTRCVAFGQAIGIGHDRKVTLEVLKEAMPVLEKEGYEFVFVSDLVK